MQTLEKFNRDDGYEFGNHRAEPLLARALRVFGSLALGDLLLVSSGDAGGRFQLGEIAHHQADDRPVRL